MTKLKNNILEKMKGHNKVSYLTKEETSKIQIATSKRMERYERDYSRKDKASHIAASKLHLNA
jgi:hypothetical protein